MFREVLVKLVLGVVGKKSADFAFRASTGSDEMIFGDLSCIA